MDEKVKYSVVLPVYNEKDNLKELYQGIKAVFDKLASGYEMIFVDDGSTDRTLEILSALKEKDSRLKVVRLRKNFGKSIGYASGFKHAGGDIVVTMNGDGQDDPVEIKKFIDKINQGYDVVSGWKYRGKGRLDKTIVSRIFNKITSLLTGIKLHDFNCSFKAYRREVLENISLYGELYRFIPVLISDFGYKITELKIESMPKSHGRSNYNAIRYFKIFLDLVTIVFLTKFKKSPLYLFGSIGFVLFFSGFMIDLYLSLQKIVYGLVLSKQPLLFLGILLMIIGVQFISIGLITEMMVNIFHKKEPDALVKEVL